MSTIFFFFFVSLISILVSVHTCIGELYSIKAGESLFPNQTIVTGGGFELGFFSPGNSSSYYLGIWYTNIPDTVVWVANRNKPIPRSSYDNARLQLLRNGTLQLIVSSDVIWDAGNSVGTSTVTEASLVMSGDLVLTDAQNIIQWTSRDHPTDTLLPGGDIGVRYYDSVETRLVSWKNPNDPAEGDYSIGLDSTNDSQLYLYYNNSEKLWRGGVFLLGDIHSPITIGSNSSHSSDFVYASGRDYMYYEYSRLDESVVTRIVMGHDGRLVNYVWEETTRAWNIRWVLPSGACGKYASCGANAICDASAVPVCKCLPGYVPRVEPAWKSLNFSDGCWREKSPSCDRDGFRKLSGVRLPANAESSDIRSSGICEISCREDCSCLAYAFSNGGCLLFKGDLLDLERLPNASAGSDILIRMANVSISRQPAEGTTRQHAAGNKILLRLALGLGIPFGILFILCSTLFCYFWRKPKSSKVPQPGADFAHQNLLLLDLNSDGPENNTRWGDRASISGEDKNSKYELPTFSFSSISAATNDFSVANKLGQGGFGPVYKGELLNGKFVAVKRLSKRSGQGLEEFKNETELIAKLQHRNLVGILGCCIENDEKILVYEYMPNKSLDFFLFDPTTKEQLDWQRRVHIIEGIAQGLLYLHQYSRLRIIHRDLKTGNILLDAEMNPKISDFGLARIFGGTELQANTKRIVGTYGYMSPEYAMEGIFSVKSDVYAFGVLLLEIISGKKNTGFYSSENLSLLGYAWNLWTNNRGMELIDPALEIHSSSSSIPLRYIQIGLLCVQNDPGERPVMSDVVAMLSQEQIPLASPKHMALPLARSLLEASPGENEVEMCSVNELTISLIEAR